MPNGRSSSDVASCAVFGPQSKAPGSRYLDEVFSYIQKKKVLTPLTEAVIHLQDNVWIKLAQSNDDIANLSQGPLHIQNLSTWITTGDSSKIANCMSGIVSLPLLVIIQTSQYLQYLDYCCLSHLELLEQLREGGIQGYCGGLPAATAIACSKNEAELVAHSAIAVRIALAIGAYGELGDDESEPGATTIVIRLKRAGQGEELIARFPGTYVSAVTDPKTISVVGPAKLIQKLHSHVQNEGMLVQEMHIRGKVHNPENVQLASELGQFCEENEGLRFPSADALQCSMRSNRTGQRIHEGSLTQEVINVILASRCEWYRLLQQVATDLDASRRRAHDIIMFGIGDCVPLSPFHQRELDITKVEVQRLKMGTEIKAKTQPSTNGYTYPKDAIAIIGASCRLPKANSLDELWTLLISGESQHKELDTERFDLFGSFRATQDQKFVRKRKFYGNFVDHADDFDHTFFGMSQKEAVNMDPQQRILLELAFQAVDSSGYLGKRYQQISEDDAARNVGCFIGASFAEYLDNTNAHPPTAYTSTGTIRAFLSGKISHYFGWNGPSEILDTACSSSLVAINRACKSLQTSECSMALAGGVNIMTGINNFLDLAKAGFLSPTGQCKPFDEAADGYCRSEGGGLVVLKRMDQALLSNDHILGVIAGVAHNQGGMSTFLTLPHSPTQMNLYHSVLQQASMSPDQVTYVEAHGTGTQGGDPLEMESIRQVFRRKKALNEVLSVGSLKGNIGHAETAAGIASLLKVLAMMQHRSIPPQANYRLLNPKILPLAPDRIEITSSLRPWNSASTLAACVNSYGAAGSNCALICCEAPCTKDEQQYDPKMSYPIIISATSTESLQKNIQELDRFLKQKPTYDKNQVGDLSYTLSERRQPHVKAFAMSANELQGLAQALKGQQQSSFFEVPKKPRKVVLAFAGQSKRTVDMPRILYDTYAQIRHYIDECNRIIQDLGHASLLPTIFQTEPVADVVTLQCGTFAMQYACAKTWIDAGLQVETLVGHSFGELTTLVISETLSLHHGLVLIASRAALMKSKWGPEPGAMLAIFSDRRLVEDIIFRVGGDETSEPRMEIACFNGPSSHVVVGTTPAIGRLESSLRTDRQFVGIKFQRLDVTHGFHSSFTDLILDDLNRIAASLRWAPRPLIPLETCGSQSADTTLTRSHPARHAREQVYFQDAVQRIEQRLGSCLWLEAGVNSPIISMIKRALISPERHHFQSVTVLGNFQSTSAVLSDITIDMWREGLNVSYWSFLPLNQSPFRQIWLPPYQFQHTAQHWLRNVDRTMEMQSKMTAQDAQQQHHPELHSVRLVEALPNSVFKVCTASQRFTRILSGHAVRSRPLCPASLYMEIAMMALQLHLGKMELDSFHFVDLCFQAALGLDSDRELSLIFKSDAGGDADAWQFSIQSSSRKDVNAKKSTSHAKGLIAKAHRIQDELSTYQRLLGDRMDMLREKAGVDNLGAQRTYGLFSRVVNYADFLQGISHINLDRTEALATINIPETARNEPEESSAIAYVDAVAIDLFIQVLGLLVNSGHLATQEDVYVATAIDRLLRSPACRFNDSPVWTVYAKFSPTSDNQISGDVFAWTEGSLAIAILGIQFTKILMSKLDRLLDAANERKPLEVGNSEIWAKNYIPSNLPCPAKELSEVKPPAANSSDGTGGLTPTSPSSPPSSAGSSGAPTQDGQAALRILSETSGAPMDSIRQEATLQGIGIDSLSAVELKDALETAYEVEIENDRFYLSSTIASILAFLGVAGTQSSHSLQKDKSTIQKHRQAASASPNLANISSQAAKISELIELVNPLDTLRTVFPTTFDKNAASQDFTEYFANVASQQDDLLLAYICEAFEVLDLNIGALSHDQRKSNSIRCLPKHARVVRRLLEILQKHGLIALEEQGSTIVGGAKGPPSRTSSELYQNFLQAFPAYADEAHLMNLTGSKLADCLTGRSDPVSLMFKDTVAQEKMRRYYTASPMLSTLTEQLVEFVKEVLTSSRNSSKTLVRILEVGAGFGGTTTRLAETLHSQSEEIQVEYLFSDISNSLVRNAESNFANSYPWMSFQTMNLEKEIPRNLQDRYDIVIGTNCVHATRNRTETIRRLRTLLNKQGFLVLSEVTQLVDWYDIVFGLLDGWWLGPDYPLQPVESWMRSFVEAGFLKENIAYSQGSSRESNAQRLLVASNKHVVTDRTTAETPPGSSVQTVIYKAAGATKIEADIYLPDDVPKDPMPVALMIHGGGYMTLSKKAVRPHQTTFLLVHGVLPVSIDYRLCPEVDMIQGPIRDVADAYAWIKTGGLQSVVRRRHVLIDAKRVIIVGWSTGGHLAMTIAWTSKDAGLEPPTALLSFYGPTDFESGDLDKPRPGRLPERTMSMEKLVSSLSPNPITSYHSTASGADDERNLGWLRRGDPRSELVLSLFSDGHGLPLLLNGIDSSRAFLCTTPPDSNLVASISPLSHVRRGSYKTPTFLIHGTEDEIVPVRTARAFYSEMKSTGVRCGLSIIDGARHIHDLKLKEGDRDWSQSVGVGYQFLFDELRIN